MEVLEISPGWGVSLETPKCELALEGCQVEVARGVRVHGCKFHFACESCARRFARRVHYGFRNFKDMRCSQCKMRFARNGNYYEIIKV